MHQKLKSRFILALAISFFLTACGGEEKKEEAAKTADSTATTAKDSVKPVVKEAPTDAVTVAPGLYKLLHDTLGVKILEATYKPGDSSAIHSHADYGLFVIEGGTAAFYAKDGTKFVNEMKTGSSGIKAAEFHSVKNIGKTTIKVLLVEINRPSGATAIDAATDPTKVAAALYKSIHDTLGIRLVMATYKPGQSSVMHAHPDCAVYAISGGTAEFTGKDGKKITNEMKTSWSGFTPADTHTVKNVGKTTMKILLVEVNRAVK